MNRYGSKAREHWAKYRPTEYAQLSDREEFFTRLGEDLEQQIDALSLSLEGEDLPGETYLEKVGRLNMAKLTAETQVLRETLPITEEDEADAAGQPSLEEILAEQLPRT